MIQVAIEKYKKVQDLNWNKSENILDYVYLPTVAEYIVTNDLTQSSLL